jgi:hypothetical protein
MKKNFFLLIFASLFFASFALSSAYYLPGIRETSYNIVQSVSDFFEPIIVVLFGQYAGIYLFEVLLIFILLVSLIFVLTAKVDFISSNKMVRWIVSIVIPLIGLRFIDYEWIYGIILQYQFFAIILASILPLVLYFFFVYGIAEDHDIIRKLLWALFVMVYFGLWSSDVSEANSNIFFWTMASGVVIILLDGVIWRRYAYIQKKKAGGFRVSVEVANINAEISRIQGMITAGHINQKDGQKIIKRLLADKDFVEKHL